MSFRSFLTTLAKKQLVSRNFALVNYNAAVKRPGWLRSIERIKAVRPLLLIPTEASQLICSLQAVEKVPGDVAEVGVAYGASAKLMLEYAPNRRFHLFDTFSGLPPLVDKDQGSQLKLKTGDFACSLEDVEIFLNSPRCSYYKGLFPETAGPASDSKFAFVHLDVDLYKSTYAGLEFFYPRMSPGGIIISHDFPYLLGVDKAVREFFEDKAEPVIELAGGYQCMMVKA